MLATEPATLQYRLNLPRVLHSVSPSLAALHTARAAALHPEASAVLNATHCPKCGTYRFSGGHLATRKRPRRTGSSRMKILQRRCRVCGFSTDACAGPSLPNDSAIMPADARSKEMDGKSPTADVIAETTAPPPLPGQQPQPKPSHKKTLLKNMLSRDRQREENAKKERKEGHGALAAFLKEL